jgi:hypothetical protein
MWLWITILVLAVLFVILVMVLSKSSRSTAAKIETLHNVPIEPSALAAIYASIGSDKRILAIKQVREATGLGLAEAKELTAAIAAGHKPPAPGLPMAEARPADAISVGKSTPDLSQRVRVLRNEGRMADAIRLVGDETGMDAMDAERFIQSLD